MENKAIMITTKLCKSVLELVDQHNVWLTLIEIIHWSFRWYGMSVLSFKLSVRISNSICTMVLATGSCLIFQNSFSFQCMYTVLLWHFSICQDIIPKLTFQNVNFIHSWFTTRIKTNSASIEGTLPSQEMQFTWKSVFLKNRHV